MKLPWPVYKAGRNEKWRLVHFVALTSLLRRVLGRLAVLKEGRRAQIISMFIVNASRVSYT